MRKVVLMLLPLVVACSPSLQTQSFFYSPNNFGLQRGTIYLKDGSSKSGLLSLQNSGKNAACRLKNDSGAIESIPVSAIYSLELEKDVLVQVSYSSTILNIKTTEFMRRLTPASASVQLFERYRYTNEEDREGWFPRSASDVGSGVHRYVLEYYARFPGDDTTMAWDLNRMFVKDAVTQRLDSLYARCTELVQRYPRKDAYGFFSFNFLGHSRSLDSKLETVDSLLGFISTYDSCVLGRK